MQKVQDEAEKLGVRIVRLSNFLEMSGYPLPKRAGLREGEGRFPPQPGSGRLAEVNRGPKRLSRGPGQ